MGCRVNTGAAGKGAASAPAALRMCIACGAKQVVRRRVTVERRDGRRVSVVADVCGACGERYFDLDAMRAMEA